MATWNTISLSSVSRAGRIDADYFRPDQMGMVRRMRQSGGSRLSSLGEIMTGATPKEYDEAGEVEVVRSGDLVAPLIYGGCGRPFLRAHLTPKLAMLRRGDVLISSIGMGSIGKISLVRNGEGLATVSEVTIVRSKRVSPEVLFAYLSGRTGQAQIEREVTGATGQQHLLKSKAGRIAVPSIPSDVAERVKGAVRRAHKAEASARKAYREAEAMLQSTLKPIAAQRQSYERMWGEVSKSQRFDAEYFQPRMQEILADLFRKGQRIADVAEVRRKRFRPDSKEAFQYIEIGDVSEWGMAVSRRVAASDAPSRAQWLVEKGDVLTTMVRPKRRISAIVQEHQDGCVCSSGFAVLRPVSLPAEVLLTYLRLPVVCEVLDLHATASMYPAITPGRLLTIPMAVPSERIQKEVVKGIRRSLRARRRASGLLEEAIGAVEGVVRE